MRTVSTNIVSDGTVMDHTSRVKGVIIIREREREGNHIVVDCIIRIIVKEEKYWNDIWKMKGKMRKKYKAEKS